MSKGVLGESVHGFDPANIFSPDILTISEYLRDCRSKESECEKKLMLAVLEQAACDLYASTGSQNYKDALRWLESKDRGWLFSFKSICEYLNFDEGYWRKGIRKLTEKAASNDNSKPRLLTRAHIVNKKRQNEKRPEGDDVI